MTVMLAVVNGRARQIIEGALTGFTEIALSAAIGKVGSKVHHENGILQGSQFARKGLLSMFFG